jgi:hypothetical protein
MRLFSLSALLLLAVTLTGCSIPIKRSVSGEKVFGERRGNDGKVVEQIVRREVTWTWYNARDLASERGHKEVEELLK